MPRIPRRTDPDLQPAPIPGARIQDPSTPEAFGGGAASQPAAQEGEGLAMGQAHEAFAEADQAHQQALQIQVQEHAATLQNEQLRQRAELEKVKGKDATPAAAQAQVDFSKFYQDMDSKIQDPDVRRAVREQYLHNDTALRAFAIPYGNSEMRSYDDTTTESFVKAKSDGIAADYDKPALVDTAIEQQKAAILDYASGARANKPKEWTDMKLAELESGGRRSVISQYLATGDDLSAKQYYDQYKSSLVGDDARLMAAAVEHGSTLGEAQRMADKIFAPTFGQMDEASGQGPSYKPGAQDMDQVRAETSKIDNPKLRKAVEDLARERFQDIKLAEHQRESAIYEDSAKLVDQNPNVSPEKLIAPDKWVAMSAEYRDALARRANKEMEDSKKWLQWMDFARDPQKTAALDQTTFETQYWSYLNKEHREKAASQWQSAGEAAAKAGQKLAEYKSIYSDRDMVLNALKGAQLGGIQQGDTIASVEKDTGAFGGAGDKAKALTDWLDRVDQAFMQAQSDSPTKKAPDDLEKKSIVNRMILREKMLKVDSGHFYMWDPEKPMKELTDGEIRKVTSGFDEIPASSLDNLKRLSKSFGSPLDPDKVKTDKVRASRAYAAAILGRDDLVRSILSGKD